MKKQNPRRGRKNGFLMPSAALAATLSVLILLSCLTSGAYAFFSPSGLGGQQPLNIVSYNGDASTYGDEPPVEDGSAENSAAYQSDRMLGEAAQTPDNDPKAVVDPTESADPTTDAAPVTKAAPTEETTEPTGETKTTVSAETTPWEAIPNLDLNYEEYGDLGTGAEPSGLTALAMVASYMDDYADYTPDKLVKKFSGLTVEDGGWMEARSGKLNLDYEISGEFDITYQALRDGKVAISLMGDPDDVESQYFLVLAGVTEDGKILVKDPNGKNYEIDALKDALENGFTREAIEKNCIGAWIYDKDAEEKPIIYYCPIKPDEPRYPEIKLTQAEKEMLASLVWLEAYGECPEGQQAVAEVVLNRLHSDRFPDDLKEVLYQEGQFSTAGSLAGMTAPKEQLEIVERAISGPYVLPEGVLFFATRALNENVYATIGNHVFCFVCDAYA